MDIKADIIYSWNQNNKVTLYLLDHIEEDWLSIKLDNKGRSIGEQLVHINNIRSFWINKVGEKMDLKIDKKYAKDKLKLKNALLFSSEKMGSTLSQLFEQETIKGFKPHSTAFYTQIIAHEAHHRGQIMTIVARNNLSISKSVNFGLWSWSNK